MIRTSHAAPLATTASAARPCGLGFGYQWCVSQMSMAVNTNDITKKRTARRLGLAAT
jgi:hypothetical protein